MCFDLLIHVKKKKKQQGIIVLCWLLIIIANLKCASLFCSSCQLLSPLFRFKFLVLPKAEKAEKFFSPTALSWPYIGQLLRLFFLSFSHHCLFYPSLPFNFFFFFKHPVVTLRSFCLFFLSLDSALPILLASLPYSPQLLRSSSGKSGK